MDKPTLEAPGKIKTPADEIWDAALALEPPAFLRQEYASPAAARTMKNRLMMRRIQVRRMARKLFTDNPMRWGTSDWDDLVINLRGSVLEIKRDTLTELVREEAVSE